MLIYTSLYKSNQESLWHQKDCFAIGFIWMAQNIETQEDDSTPPQNSGVFAPLERVCVVFLCLW